MSVTQTSIISDLIGHEKALSIFRKALREERLPHAWLVSGPAGVGKNMLVLSCAKLLLDIQPGMDSERRFLAGTHDGIIEIKRGVNEENGKKRRDISVEEVRRLNHFFQITSENAAWRVAIIDDAEHLSGSAANALLKIVEEPPPCCIFFLITSRLGNMPETLRSRCRLLKLFPLSDINMRRIFPNISDDVLIYAKGSPGTASLLLQKEYQDIPAYVDLSLKGESSLEINEKLKQMKNQEGMSLFYSLLQNGIGYTAWKAAKDKKAQEASEWTEKYFKVKKLLLDSEQFSLEREQVLIEILDLVKK